MCTGVRTDGSCLVPASQVQTIQAGVCGNGVKEEGEDCDCGLGCDSNDCCDGATCKFKNGAKCDDSFDGCCDQCQPLALNAICRESKDFCSASSKCDGVSGNCPASVLQPDGKSCRITSTLQEISGTSCASGTCTSRRLQCLSLISSGSFQTVDACAGTENQCSKLCETRDGTCLNVSGDFMDGTPCSGGRCRDGSCNVTDPFAVLVFYFETQPQVAYPIAIALALVILAMLSCCYRGCVGYMQKGKPKDQQSSRSASRPTLAKSIGCALSIFGSRIRAGSINSTTRSKPNTPSDEQTRTDLPVRPQTKLESKLPKKPKIPKPVKNPQIPSTSSTSSSSSLLPEFEMTEDFSLMPEPYINVVDPVTLNPETTSSDPLLLASSSQFGAQRGYYDRVDLDGTDQNPVVISPNISLMDKQLEQGKETAYYDRVDFGHLNKFVEKKETPSVPKKPVSLMNITQERETEAAYYDRVDFGQLNEKEEEKEDSYTTKILKGVR